MSTARRSNSRREKRGIVLILVISLLALFILMGVTFALVSASYLSSSKVDKEIQRVGDSPAVETDLVLQPILCDTYARTVLSGHSFLADIYGGDWVTGTVSIVIPNVDPMPAGATQGQLLKIRVPVGSFSQVPHYYAGRVITFTPMGTGPLPGSPNRYLVY